MIVRLLLAHAILFPCFQSQCVVCPRGKYDPGNVSRILCSYMTSDNNYFQVRLKDGQVQGQGWGSCSTDLQILPDNPNFAGMVCPSNSYGGGWCQIGCQKLIAILSPCLTCSPSTYSSADGAYCFTAHLSYQSPAFFLLLLFLLPVISLLIALMSTHSYSFLPTPSSTLRFRLAPSPPFILACASTALNSLA